MCLIAFAYQVHPLYELILIGNRDEFHARPSDALHAHVDAPGVYGGRDAQAGGGWLLVHAAGRLVTVTNVRHGSPEQAKRSRGQLVKGLITDTRPAAALHAISDAEAKRFGRFNALAFDRDGLSYLRNFPEVSRERLGPGVYGLSNGALNTPWPKVARTRSALEAWLDRGDADPTALLDILKHQQQFADAELPDTGVGLEWERLLSSPFIVGEHYGTRASSLVLVGRDQIRFIEQSFGPNATPLGQRELLIAREPA
ncbi:NRDE family protein [Ahniella affigens]|nr:NRDE family protein [Ahniella affigens]